MGMRHGVIGSVDEVSERYGGVCSVGELSSVPVYCGFLLCESLLLKKHSESGESAGSTSAVDLTLPTVGANLSPACVLHLVTIKPHPHRRGQSPPHGHPQTAILAAGERVGRVLYPFGSAIFGESSISGVRG